MSHAIQLSDLSWRPDRSFVVKDLSLSVPEGAIYGFLGANGAGKSSTIKLLMGMMRAQAGEIRVLGRTVPRDMPSILADVGYVPERPHLYRNLSVREALTLHRSFFPRWDTERVAALLDRMELDPGRSVRRLSKGETGKLMITLALATRPRLLVLDEPTDGLDPVVRRDIVATLVDYVSEAGATVFVSSHLVHELERICDWIGVIDRGRMVTEVPMEDFRGSIKRLRLEGTPGRPEVTPFALLERAGPNGVCPLETWVVQGWRPEHERHLAATGVEVREVVDLDLEEGFVALLRATRGDTVGTEV